MLKVFHINSNYLTSRLHENLIEKLEKKNISNTIYMPIKKETVDEFLYESDFDIQAPVTFKNRDKYIFTWKQRKIIKKMEQIYDFNDIDVIHAHTLFTDGNVAHYISEKYNIPFIVTVRGMTDIDGFFKKRPNLRARGRNILKDASRIVFLSESNKQTLFANYIKDNKTDYEVKSKVIPNGIDDFWFDNEFKPKELAAQSTVNLLFVGKIKKSKNPLSVIETMRILKNDFNIQAEATFIGKVVDQDIYDELKAVKDVPVKLLPATDKESLIKIYRNNDIFIMPSFSETFGLVYPEAMSQGLPVIYSKNQGFDEQFEYGKVGFPVDPHDAKDIAIRIKEIINNYPKMSENAIDNYKKFNWEYISDKHIQNYRTVCQKGKEDNLV